ncbi:MAG: class I SAM-dependent methyltransferase, partial [Syntrophales bacterium LBB04]|nr:class I SAM-dependent methyltransferase [Syntrophales bacterium LBB04]
MKNPFISLLRSKHVCPWWLCFTFDNFLRPLFHDPVRMLKGYIREGDTVLDVGPGMGYFTIPMARMVGETGKVIAADVQQRMLTFLESRAKKAGLARRIEPHLVSQESLGIDEPLDFALAFWMVHEVPDQGRFLEELKSLLKPGGLFLLVEPAMHVSKKMYRETEHRAQAAGLALKEKPKIFMSRSTLFV